MFVDVIREDGHMIGISPSNSRCSSPDASEHKYKVGWYK